jgi:hypothetical protein
MLMNYVNEFVVLVVVLCIVELQAFHSCISHHTLVYLHLQYYHLVETEVNGATKLMGHNGPGYQENISRAAHDTLISSMSAKSYKEIRQRLHIHAHPKIHNHYKRARLSTKPPPKSHPTVRPGANTVPSLSTSCL